MHIFRAIFLSAGALPFEHTGGTHVTSAKIRVESPPHTGQLKIHRVLLLLLPPAAEKRAKRNRHLHPTLRSTGVTT